MNKENFALKLVDEVTALGDYRAKREKKRGADNYCTLQDMKTDNSLTCLQNSFARSCLEPDESVTHHHISLSL